MRKSKKEPYMKNIMNKFNDMRTYEDVLADISQSQSIKQLEEFLSDVNQWPERLLVENSKGELEMYETKNLIYEIECKLGK